MVLGSSNVAPRAALGLVLVLFASLFGWARGLRLSSSARGWPSLSVPVRPPLLRRRTTLIEGDGPGAAEHKLPPRTSTSFKEGEFVRDRAANSISFGGSVSIDADVLELSPNAITEYLSNPGRLLSAAWDRNLIEHVDGHVFRLQMRPIRFASVNVDNTVEVEVEYAASGAVSIQSRSVDTRVRVGRRGREKQVKLGLEVSGTLEPQHPDAAHGHLTGGVGFRARARLIKPLTLLPDRLLKPAASAVNKRMLRMAGSRFVDRVTEGASGWCREQQ